MGEGAAGVRGKLDEGLGLDIKPLVPRQIDALFYVAIPDTDSKRRTASAALDRELDVD